MTAPVAYPALREILPHRPPMILIDELLHCGPADVVCGVTVRDGAPFVEAGQISALISLEYFAQTVAALYGYNNRHSEEFKVGMLLGTRDLELRATHFRVGEAFTVTGQEVWSGGQMAQFRCELLRGGAEVVARAAISVLHGSPADIRAEAQA